MATPYQKCRDKVQGAVGELGHEKRQGVEKLTT